MRFVKPSAEVIKTIGESPFEVIERAGRTCYKSNSDMTHETGVAFFKQLVDAGHHAMLEHATFLFLVPHTSSGYYNNLNPNRPFLRSTSVDGRLIVSANLRAIKEGGYTELQRVLIRPENYPELNYYFRLPVPTVKESEVTLVKNPTLDFFKELSNKEIDAHAYTTIHFITDRGVSHEMVRHRIASFAQESTRYCNYSKEKFGGEITFNTPAGFESLDDETREIYVNSLKNSEEQYFKLIEKGCTPQFARGVLPTDTKTEVIMTANHEEWEHFFNLRYFGLTGKPHPNMLEVATKAYTAYCDNMINNFGKYFN